MPEIVIGAFTVGVARLSRWEGPSYDKAGLAEELAAVYAAILAAGTIATPAAVSGLPAINSAHATLVDLRCHGYDFGQVSDNKTGYDIWEIRALYSRGEANETGEAFGTSRLTAAEWDTHDWEADLTEDSTTNLPFQTASGGAYDAAPKVQRYGRLVRFSRLQSAHPAAMTALSGTLNSGEVTCLGATFAARTAMVRVTGRDRLVTTGLRYEVTVEIREKNTVGKFDGSLLESDIGWDVGVLEADFYYREGEVGEGDRVRFMEREEGDETNPVLRPSATPQMLTLLGTDNRAGTPVYRRWHTAKSAAWTALRLPA